MSSLWEVYEQAMNRTGRHQNAGFEIWSKGASESWIRLNKICRPCIKQYEQIMIRLWAAHQSRGISRCRMATFQPFRSSGYDGYERNAWNLVSKQGECNVSGKTFMSGSGLGKKIHERLGGFFFHERLRQDVSPLNVLRSRQYLLWASR